MSGLVWLKRDLRVEDHGPLAAAAAAGPTLAVYVYEPSLWARPELDASHLAFIDASLEQLEAALEARGGRIAYRVGELPEVFDRLHAELPFCAVHAHEETGLLATWDRDRRVARWCQDRGVVFREYPQFGVFRPHPVRDGWAGRWEARLKTGCVEPPRRIPTPELPPGFDFGRRLAPCELGLSPSEKTEAQPGGAKAGKALLDGFLDHRGAGYRRRMSSPVTAWTGCSRLSPHLAYGSLSLKTVLQATLARDRRAAARPHDPTERERRLDLEAFGARLRWHCHFIQKLEDEPELELRNGHRGYDGLRREGELGPSERSRLDAWRHGQTGFSLVDAVMRCLHRTGWVNFRMRAMLASFATHHLWLHWRAPAVALAPHFLDFEPGIHFAQFQMQAGTMGINRLRVYDVVKQAREQDPDGRFIRRWVPELARVPGEFVHQPERMPADLQRKLGCIIGRHYPAPIVDHGRAAAAARARLESVRRRIEVRQEAERVRARHGSRKRAR